MAFFSRFRSRDYSVVLRRPANGCLVGRRLHTEVDFTCQVLDENGLILPDSARDALEAITAAQFQDRLLIDNNDPYADDLMKLKRIGAANPALFDHGTSGPQLCFQYGRQVEEWLARQSWNPSAVDDPAHVQIVLATIKLDDDLYFYDLA